MRTLLPLLFAGCPGPAPTPRVDAPTPATEDPGERRWEVLPSDVCTPTNSAEFVLFDEPTWTEQTTTPEERSPFMAGAGFGVADLTGDDLPEILLPNDENVTFWWTDQGNRRGPELLVPAGMWSGATPVDYDGDGDLDIYLSRYNGADRLIRNNGQGGLQDVTAEAGFDTDPYGVGSSWADMDGDGDLDVLVLKHGNWNDTMSAMSRVYENRGDGTFVDRTSDIFTPEPAGLGHTLAGGFIDLDGDVRPEIYIVNDYGWNLPNYMLWNDGQGAYQVASPQFGLNIGLCGMGLASGDIDGDGIPDLFHAGWLDLRYLASGAGVWVDFTAASGFSLQESLDRHVSWGPDFGDIDNDGDLDLFVGYGRIHANIDNPDQQPDALFIQQDDGMFVERAEDFGLAEKGATRGAALVDVNGDGWLDLLKRNHDASPVLLLGSCRENAWLEVELRQEGMNTRAIGARLRILGEDGAPDATRWIRAGGRSLSVGGPPQVHFGLGEREEVDIEILWPDGDVDLVEAVPTRQRIRIHR